MTLDTLTPAEVASWKPGERLLLNGKMLTGRDAAHKRITDMIARGEKLPVDFTNRAIYYVGPVDPVRGKRLSQLEMMDVVRQYASTIPGGRIALQDISQTGFSPSRGGGFPIEFNIRGRDWNLLADASRRTLRAGLS